MRLLVATSRRIDVPQPAWMPPFRYIKRAFAASATVAAVAGGLFAASGSADLTTQIQANNSVAASIQSQINSDTSQIEKTAGGVAVAEQRLTSVQAQLEQHIHELTTVQTNLMESRQRLLRLERRLTAASKDLSKNLTAEYENGSPNLVDVILNSSGFSNLLNQVGYLKDAQKADARDVSVTKTARTEVMKQATNLGELELRDQRLTNSIVTQRNQAGALEAALVKQQIDEENTRANAKSKLAGVQAHTAKLEALEAEQKKKEEAIEAAAEAAARQTPVQVNQQEGGLAINTGGMVQPPAGAPDAVGEMMAAGNAIATLPYIWGGGHGSFESPGYDCSGSVSYVLDAAGLLSSPETSGEFESYGDAGPGQWVTIYATAGHVWMTIAGWRFDTVALAEDGTRWSQGGGEFGGYVERHPVGL
jgi:septal ring factor EnvC (AmiA/AmiB activator)